MLTRANVKEGEIVLVTGASGGVGFAAVQLAKARDAQALFLEKRHIGKIVLEI